MALSRVIRQNEYVCLKLVICSSHDSENDSNKPFNNTYVIRFALL